MLGLKLSRNYWVNAPVLVLTFFAITFGVSWILAEDYECGKFWYMATPQPCPYVYEYYQGIIGGGLLLVSAILGMVYAVGGIMCRIRS